MKQVVVTRKQIEQTLIEGGYVRWLQWDAKAELLDNTREVIGTIRFDTYLKLDLRESAMKEPITKNFELNDEASPFRRLKRLDPWQGYDDYNLRVDMEDTPYKDYFLKKMWR